MRVFKKQSIAQVPVRLLPEELMTNLSAQLFPTHHTLKNQDKSTSSKRATYYNVYTYLKSSSLKGLLRFSRFVVQQHNHTKTVMFLRVFIISSLVRHRHA